jgi:aryl-alcohol dehydrogenase-like predicted oxidoreductase
LPVVQPGHSESRPGHETGDFRATGDRREGESNRCGLRRARRAAALQFPLAHPAVAAVVPGPRDVAEFEANLKLLRHPIPPALWEDLQAEKLLHPEAPTPG